MTMVAKFKGKCRACGCEIRKGSTIEWSKAEGARHFDCRNTAATGDAARKETRFPLCPTCKVTPISWEYKRRGYQCDHCADIDEGKAFGMEW